MMDLLVRTISRAYPNVLSNLPNEFFDFDNFSQPSDNCDNYAVTMKLGRGKYSEVFEAVHLPSNDHVVLKILKPIKNKKIKREIRILEVLRGGINIINLLSVITNEKLKVIFKMSFFN